MTLSFSLYPQDSQMLLVASMELIFECISFVVVRRQFAALNLRNREYSQLTQKYRKDNRVISGLAKRVKKSFCGIGIKPKD